MSSTKGMTTSAKHPDPTTSLNTLDAHEGKSPSLFPPDRRFLSPFCRDSDLAPIRYQMQLKADSQYLTQRSKETR